jgi:N-carbamoylputrescine amidase
VGHEVDPSGVTPGSLFWGSSFVCDSLGRVLKEAPHDAESVEVVELDLAQAELDRRIWPFFRDRRIDAYAPLLQRYGQDVARRNT